AQRVLADLHLRQDVRPEELPLGDLGGSAAGDSSRAGGGSGAGGRDDRVDDLGERERICLNALSATKALDVGTLAARAGLTVADALSALALLEIE
ncbi:hypothetical protein KCW65_23975, partial [Mycobacterium tuberculosis]|nr:hypothetical protein [Mycobacterium tuberculosis]